MCLTFHSSKTLFLSEILRRLRNSSNPFSCRERIQLNLPVGVVEEMKLPLEKRNHVLPSSWFQSPALHVRNIRFTNVPPICRLDCLVCCEQIESSAHPALRSNSALKKKAPGRRRSKKREKLKGKLFCCISSHFELCFYAHVQYAGSTSKTD